MLSECTVGTGTCWAIPNEVRTRCKRGPNEVQNVSNSSPCSKVQSWRSFQIRQPAGVSDWKVLFLVSVLGLYLFLCSLCSWRLLLYSSTPLLLYSSTPLLLYSSAPLLLYSSTPLLLYSSTPLLLYSSTPLLLYSSAPLLLYSSTIFWIFYFPSIQSCRQNRERKSSDLIIRDNRTPFSDVQIPLLQS